MTHSPSSLISADYRDQNAALHKQGNWAISGQKHARLVLRLARRFKVNALLDYGCGQQSLKAALKDTGLTVTGYDPCIEGVDAPAEPHDFVTCLDVLEHIEPELLDNVLDDLQRVTRKHAYIIVATRPAKAVLPDGRNAHLINEKFDWWLPKFEERFDVMASFVVKKRFEIVCRARTAGEKRQSGGKGRALSRMLFRVWFLFSRLVTLPWKSRKAESA